MFLAKALYDNVAETPDELAFRRGDVITVMAQDNNAGAGALGRGWWLCSLRGRQGIAPGNRLKILSGIAVGEGDGEGTGDLPQTVDAGANSVGWRLNLGTSLNKSKRAVTQDHYEQPNVWRKVTGVSPSPHTPSRVASSPTPDSPLYAIPSRLSAGSNDNSYDNLPSLLAVTSNVNTTLYSNPTDIKSFNTLYSNPTDIKTFSTLYSNPTDIKTFSTLYSNPTDIKTFSDPTTMSSMPKVNVNSIYEVASFNQPAAMDRSPPLNKSVSLSSLSSNVPRSPLSMDQHQLSVCQMTTSNNERSVHRRIKKLSTGCIGTSSSPERHDFKMSAVKTAGKTRYQSSPPGNKRMSLGTFVMDEPIYDTPACSQSVIVTGEVIYDTPSPIFERQCRMSTGTENRDSVLSTASSDSCLSGSSLYPTSSPHSSVASMSDSATSALDPFPQEPARIPPRKKRISKQSSRDSGCGGVYDTPGRMSHIPIVLTSPPVATSSAHQSRVDGGDGSKRDVKRGHSRESTGRLYNVPRSDVTHVSLKTAAACSAFTTAVSDDVSAEYDVPHQGTQHVKVSACSDSPSDRNVRLSCRSTDSNMSGSDCCPSVDGDYEDLVLDLDSAVELLVKLDESVTKSSTRLLMFVSSKWRTSQFLQSNISDIKSACTDLKKAMSDFLEFAQGTLDNSAHVSDRKLINRLGKQVTHLQHQDNAMSAALQSLEAIQWKVALLAEPLDPNRQDHLDDVISLAKDLSPEVKQLVSLIQGNSTLLFKRPSVTAASSKTAHGKSKPSVAPKPKVRKVGKRRRKLTGVPMSLTRSAQSSLRAASGSVSRKSLPKQTLHSLQMKKVQDSLYDYVNMTEEGLRRCTLANDGDKSDRDDSARHEEYDYVQLVPGDAAAQQISKQQQQQQQSEYKQVLKIVGKVFEPPNIPVSVKSGHSQTKSQRLKTSGPIKTKAESVQRHTQMMFADLGESCDDVGMEHTSEDITEIYAVPKRKGLPVGLVNSEAGSDNPPSPPTPSSTGLNIASHAQLSSPVDVTSKDSNLNDKQILCYYSKQLETQFKVLTGTINTFFTSVQNNDPPKMFIANIKLVVVTGCKLVYIGDAIYRSVGKGQIRDQVMYCASHLCDCLKMSVQATKTAALQSSSVSAMQHMMRRVEVVSHAARDLRLVITHATTL